MRIAMKCSKEQFDAIKGKLVGCKVEGVFNFEHYNYLMNYRFGVKNHITNYTEGALIKDDACIYNEWNEKIFLNACGIETERIFKGSELQYRNYGEGEWYDAGCFEYRIKPSRKQEIENQILELQNQLKNL